MEGFPLTVNIVIPSMEEITDEILLRPSKAVGGTAEKTYEYNDAHASNAHRFYLLNGLASGGGDRSETTAIETARGPRSPHSTSAPSLAFNGGPLSLGEITSAALTSLNARTRIEAEREMVFHNPLFEQFVRAVGSKGFFSDKPKKDKKNETAPQSVLSPEEEQKRAKVVYEEKYRKVVNKFRNKLAAKEEISQQQQIMQQYQYGYQSPNMMQPNYSPGNNAVAARDASTMANCQRRRREEKAARVRAGGRDGYSLNMERMRLNAGKQVKRNHLQMQPQATENHSQQPQGQQQEIVQRSQYQPLHQVHAKQQPQLPPTTQRQQHSQQPRRNTPQQTPLSKPLGNLLDSTKSSLTTQFDFNQHNSPFESTPSSKPPKSPPRLNRSFSPTIQQLLRTHSPTPTIQQLNPGPKPQTPPRYPPSKEVQQNIYLPETEEEEEEDKEDDEEELLNQHEAEQLNSEGNGLMQQKQFQAGEL
jgi:hypothetical protein